MPARVRVITGLIGSVLMLLSSIPHTVLGWPAQRQVLLQSHVSADTILGLSVGWYFGGMAIAVFGLIAVVSFVQVMRGHAPHMRATTIIGFAYTGFGLWAWLVTRDGFALVFIVPGLLVLTGSTAAQR
ncbi:hypothetical protein LuPra_05176 [Luteitalea pratensis]|uniref:Uncharacterized protein n=1 Tax=Luteitalea pratensis TaxID=1855912 RepID=A0A143PT52_LUTPR|nr:hypothetical protein [Luteitalea pratensis]AMY11907.1 hypothetical protein LuPra_05176 [Luteitalea pratensis]